MGKPLAWAGYGIRLAGKVGEFREFIERTGIPFVTTWGGADLVPTDHPLNVGIVGISGQPGANKAVHHCDHLMILGSQRGLCQTSTLVDEFAPNAVQKIQHSDFVFECEVEPSKEWLAQCAEWKKQKPRLEGSYLLNDTMTRMLPPGCVMVVDGGGTALYTGFQSSHIKEGSRLICSTGISAMGSGLPEAVGACLASGKLTTCLIGDGSLMFNIQELQTIKHHHLPIKIFVLNNGGYEAIKHTQDGFLEGRQVGVGKPHLSWPDLAKVAAAFGIPFIRGTTAEHIGVTLDSPGPAMCEWVVPGQKMVRQQYEKRGDRFYPRNLGEMEQ